MAKKYGKGKLNCANGSMYEGRWVDDKMHGKGTMKYASGSVYEGGWTDGKIYGAGKYKYANGDVYEGEWENGIRHGKGTYKYVGSGNVYEGKWKDGKEHGKGTARGNVYEGEWKDGKEHDKGTFKWANGDMYTGEWNNNKRHGNGTKEKANGEVYNQVYSHGKVLQSKRLATAINDPPPKCFCVNEATEAIQLVEASVSIQMMPTASAHLPASLEAEDGDIENDIHTQPIVNSNATAEVTGDEDSDSDTCTKAFYIDLCEQLTAKIIKQKAQIKLLKGEIARGEATE